MATTKVGQRVTIRGKEEEYGEGTVKFVGTVKFDAGKWVGIELDKPLGKHDGLVKGERYFQTKPNHAVFIKYGQTNAATSTTAPVAAKKAPPATSSTASGAKKAPAKAPATKPGSSSKTTPEASSPSQVSSESPSTTTTPPNELDDIPVEVMDAASDVSGELQPSASNSSLVSDRALLSPSPSSPQLVSPSPSPTPQVVPADEVSSSPSAPAIVAPEPAPPKTASITSLPLSAKPSTPASPQKSLPTSPRAPSSVPASPNKAPVPVKTTVVEVPPMVLPEDDGPSAYELDLKIKSLENQLEEIEDENEQLKAEKVRLESQISILKEGSEVIMAQQKAGGAEREALEADLRGQIRELSRKLENSSERYSELEKKSRDLEHQLSNLTKSSAEQLTSAVQKATAEVSAELAKLKAETEDKIETLQTDLEMVTMDKEIAEEERDTAVKEMEQLKLQNEMLEAYKQATESAKESSAKQYVVPVAPGSISGEQSDAESSAMVDVTKSTEYQTLYTQHERLKEALVKLKDMAVEEKQAHERTTRELENLTLRVMPSLEEKVLKLSEQNVDYEEQIELLKANVDDSSELQAKFNDLFDKKLDLEEDNQRMKGALAELEALRDLSEELEEAQAAAETRLKAELYEKQVEVLDREAAIKNAKEEIAQQQVLIDRLQTMLNDQRTATSTVEKKLAAALKQAKRRRRPLQDQDLESMTEEYEVNELEDEDGAAKSDEDTNGLTAVSSTTSLRSLPSKETELQIILQKQAAKAAIQTVVDKLKELDRQQAIEQFALYQSFVPENYIRVDAEAIRCLLLNKRLTEKSSIIVAYLQEQFHLERFERSVVVQEDPSTLSPLAPTEELAAFAWNLASLVTRIGNNASIIAESFKNADNDSYLRFARLQSELAPLEKKLDHLLTLLQQEQLTVAFSLQDFETLLDQTLEPLVFQHCQLTALPAHQHYTRIGNELVFASRACFFEIVALKTSVNQLATTLQLGEPSALLAIVDLISLTIVKYLVDGSRKLRRSAEGRPALVYSGNTLAQLYAAAKLTRTLHALFASLRQRIIAAGERMDLAVLNELKESLVAQFTPTIEAASSSLPPQDVTAGHLTKYFDAFVTSALKLLFSVDEEISRGAHDATTELTKPMPRIVDGVAVSTVQTLQARAALLLEEVASAAGLKGELAGLQKELREREAALSTKTKEIEDLEWKSKKQEHRLQTLEKVEAEAKEELSSHQKNYASQVMNLETSNRDLLEKLEQLKAETEEAKLAAATHSTRASTLEEQLTATLQKQQQSISLDSATTQISSLKGAVRHLRAQVTRLRTAEARAVLATKLPPLSFNQVARPAAITKPKQEKEDVENVADSVTPAASPAPASSASQQQNAHEETHQTSPENKRMEAARALSSTAARLMDTAYTLTTAPLVVDLARTDNTPQQQLESLQFEELRVKAAILKASRETVAALADSVHASAPSNFSNFPSTSFVAGVNSTAQGPVKVGRLTLPAPLKMRSEKSFLSANSAPTPIQVTPADLSSIHELFVK